MKIKALVFFIAIFGCKTKEQSGIKATQYMAGNTLLQGEALFEVAEAYGRCLMADIDLDATLKAVGKDPRTSDEFFKTKGYLACTPENIEAWKNEIPQDKWVMSEMYKGVDSTLFWMDVNLRILYAFRDKYTDKYLNPDQRSLTTKIQLEALKKIDLSEVEQRVENLDQYGLKDYAENMWRYLTHGHDQDKINQYLKTVPSLLDAGYKITIDRDSYNCFGSVVNKNLNQRMEGIDAKGNTDWKRMHTQLFEQMKETVKFAARLHANLGGVDDLLRLSPKHFKLCDTNVQATENFEWLDRKEVRIRIDNSTFSKNYKILTADQLIEMWNSGEHLNNATKESKVVNFQETHWEYLNPLGRTRSLIQSLLLDAKIYNLTNILGFERDMGSVSNKTLLKEKLQKAVYNVLSEEQVNALVEDKEKLKEFVLAYKKNLRDTDPLSVIIAFDQTTEEFKLNLPQIKSCHYSDTQEIKSIAKLINEVENYRDGAGNIARKLSMCIPPKAVKDFEALYQQYNDFGLIAKASCGAKFIAWGGTCDKVNELYQSIDKYLVEHIIPGQYLPAFAASKSFTIEQLDKLK